MTLYKAILVNILNCVYYILYYVFLNLTFNEDNKLLAIMYTDALSLSHTQTGS